MTAMFAGDTAILTTSKNRPTPNDNLQFTIDNIFNWTRDVGKYILLGIKLWISKYCWIMQQSHENIQQNTWGMHHDSRLNLKHHVRHKKLQIKEKMLELYWLVGRHFTLDHFYKWLLYVATWTFGIQLWGRVSNSNIHVIQRCQNIAIRTISVA